MRLRNLIAAVAAMLAVLGLAACGDSKAGVAATVGEHRISEADVASYVAAAGPEPTVAAQAEAAGQSLRPRVTALGLLIRTELVEQTLRGRGGVPGQAKLDALRDVAFQTFLGIPAQQLPEFLKTLPQRLQSSGFSPKYQGLLERNLELQTELISRVQATSQADLDKAVQDAGIPVSVSSRYGSWNSKTLQLSSNPTDGLPSFVEFKGAGQSPAPAAG